MSYAHRHAPQVETAASSPVFEGSDDLQARYGNSFAQQSMGLPPAIRRRFEDALGLDLGDVRLHTGPDAADQAGAAGASALAFGSDILFAEGEADFSSPDGVRLLAHEVAHTVQQRDTAPRPQREAPGTAASGPDEEQADEAAEDLVAGDDADWMIDEEDPANVDPATLFEDEVEPSFDGLAALPPEEQGAAIRDLSDEQFEALVDGVPKGDSQAMIAVVQSCDDPARKLILWQQLHGTLNERELEELHPEEEMGENPDEMMEWGRRNDTIGQTEVEVRDEVARLQAKGEDLTMDDVDALISRKEREHALEMKYNINLTNDSDADIAERDGEPRERRTWTEADLAWFEEELPKLPAEHVRAVTEFRRSSQKHRQDDDGDWHADRALAVHYGDTGRIEIYDAGLSAPGALVHEVGHNVDLHHQDLRAAYDEAAGWRDYEDKADLEAEIGADGLARLDAAGAAQVEVNGRIYRSMKDDEGNVSWRGYNRDAIPGTDTTEATTGGWTDEWDYARTGGADLFADHYKLAARDPVRLHRDMIEGPAKKVADLEASGAPASEIAAARRHAETLAGQWDLMRERVNGVTDELIDEHAPSGLDEETDRAFRAQAERCCTPRQVEDLALAYENGDQVDEAAIDAVLQEVPLDQQAAFAEDARNCFSRAQLEKLTEAYAKGGRKDRKWTPGQVGEATMLGT